MRWRIRASIVLATVLACASTWMAPANAEPIPMRPLNYDKVSRDGWHLNIRVDNELVNPVPNLANSDNSKEAFVTASATATAVGGSSPITDSIFILGYQLGCQADVSAGLQYGGTGGAAPLANVAGGDLSLGIAGGGAGFVQTVLQPGVIVDLPLSNMTLNSDGVAMIDIDNIHVKADACWGDVTIRSYAYFRISTDVAHTQFAIYGDPIKI